MFLGGLSKYFIKLPYSLNTGCPKFNLNSKYFKQSQFELSRYYCTLLFVQPGPEVIKLFSCSTQLSTKFILLINVKMPIIVGILTFISRINTSSESLKARNIYIFSAF